jgi:molecular chaperone DnaK (HSP70)
MDIDANGILRVHAEETRSGAKASFTIEPCQPSSIISQMIDIIIKYHFIFM